MGCIPEKMTRGREEEDEDGADLSVEVELDEEEGEACEVDADEVARCRFAARRKGRSAAEAAAL